MLLLETVQKEKERKNFSYNDIYSHITCNRGEKTYRKQPKYPTMGQQLTMTWQDVLMQSYKYNDHMARHIQKISEKSKQVIFI